MEVLTETEKSLVRAALDEGRRIAESVSAANKHNAERSRLEREVVTRAKAFTDDKEPRDNWDALVAYRELCRAVDALNKFEFQQDAEKSR